MGLPDDCFLKLSSSRSIADNISEILDQEMPSQIIQMPFAVPGTNEQLNRGSAPQFPTTDYPTLEMGLFNSNFIK